MRIAPFDVHFSDENILRPGILFVKKEHLNKINRIGLSGAPDLMIEILSPFTSQVDFEEKKLVYERFGVQEYFIVDPGSKTVYPYFLVDRAYETQETQVSIIISHLLDTEIVF